MARSPGHAAKAASRSIGDGALPQNHTGHADIAHWWYGPNMRLNQPKKRASKPLLCTFGFRRSAASAGLSDRALNAERITEMAMVAANCW